MKSYKAQKSERDRAKTRRSCKNVPDELRICEPRLRMSKYGFISSGGFSEESDVLPQSMRGVLGRRTVLAGKRGGALAPTLPSFKLPPINEDE